MVNTIIAPSASGIATFIFKKPCGGRKDIRLDFSALTNGILAGLVGVTAGCATFEPWAGFIVGFLSAFVYIGAGHVMNCIKVDDPLEATQVHGCCGMWGVLAVAFF
jgi:Amt family ammonium transporter